MRCISDYLRIGWTAVDLIAALQKLIHVLY